MLQSEQKDEFVLHRKMTKMSRLDVFGYYNPSILGQKKDTKHWRESKCQQV